MDSGLTCESYESQTVNSDDMLITESPSTWPFLVEVKIASGSDCSGLVNFLLNVKSFMIKSN
jgi:hypothetical protein